MNWKSWKLWAAVAAVVLAIVAVVLYFVCPAFCYAVSGLLIGALGGFIGGYFVGKKNVVAAPKVETSVAQAPEKKAAPKPRKPQWP